MNLKISKYHVVTPCFFDEVDQWSKRIVFATRTAQLRVISNTSWKIIESGVFNQLPEELLSDLIDIELLVPSNEDELEEILRRNNTAIGNDDTLYLVIQPTAHCQLGCGYCGQEHSLKWLNAKHQDALIQQTHAKLAGKQFRHVCISWFGAEPLSGMSVMRSLTPRLRALAEVFNCTYSASVITNGLALTEKVATELVEKHAIRSIHVTLDGTAEFHDVRRNQKNGLPTFNQIFTNVVGLARRTDLDVEIAIRTNVDGSNYEGVFPLLRMLAEAGIQQRVSYYIAPIHSWGNDADVLSLSPEEFAAREIEWFCEMVRLGFSTRVIPARRPVVCLAVQPHGVLTDATGTLFNCTEVSYVPTYGLPNKFAIGHVSTGEIPGKRNLIGDFNGRVARGQYPCASCRMLPVCGGACPKAWMEGREPCPSTRHNIEARLLLWYATYRLVGESDYVRHN